jgi:hypothetical protein
MSRRRIHWRVGVAAKKINLLPLEMKINNPVQKYRVTNENGMKFYVCPHEYP